MADKKAAKAAEVKAAEAPKEASPAPKTNVVELPKADADEPLSALSGVTIMAIDTDPEESLRLVRENILQNGWTLLSVIQHEFHGRPPYGFIVVYYDPKADKGHADFGKEAPKAEAPAATAPAAPSQALQPGVATALSEEA